MMDNVEELAFARWLCKRLPAHSGDPQLRAVRRRADIAVWRFTTSHDKSFRSGNPVILHEYVKTYRPDLLVEWRLSQ